MPSDFPVSAITDRFNARNQLFENFEIMPLFDVGIAVIVDPKIVDDWAFSGWDGGDIGHT